MNTDKRTLTIKLWTPLRSQGIREMLPFLYIEEISFGCESNLWWLERITHRKVDTSLIETTTQNQ